MHGKLLVVLTAIAALALPGLAQDSKLNGTWTLNVSKSSFGQFPPPTSETDTITVAGNDFKQVYTSVTTRGEQKGMRSCTVDGKEVNLTPDDARVQLGAIKLSKMQCSWEGSAVVFLETANFNGRRPYGQVDVFFRRRQDHDHGLAHHFGHHEWRSQARLR